jgi:predicted deacylase
LPRLLLLARRVAGQTRVFLFCHGGKSSSGSPLPGEPTVVVAVALRGEEYYVVAAVKGHELETPEAEHRPRLKRLLEATHLELNGKVFVNTQRAPTWRANCRRFRPARSVSQPMNLLLRAPAQMG